MITAGGERPGDEQEGLREVCVLAGVVDLPSIHLGILHLRDKWKHTIASTSSAGKRERRGPA